MREMDGMKWLLVVMVVSTNGLEMIEPIGTFDTEELCADAGEALVNRMPSFAKQKGVWTCHKSSEE